MSTGVCLFLSFPKLEYGFLVWGALVPLLYALRNKGLPEAFRLGLVAGLAYNVGIVYWVTFVIVNYGYLPFYIAVGVMLLLVLYLSLYVAAFAAGVAYFQNRNIPVIVTAPVLWTCLEYVKSHLLTGFPWENLAYALYDSIPIIQVADITGIYGLSFLVVLVNCAIFEIVILTGDSKKRAGVGALVAIVGIVAIYAYGMYRLDRIERDLATLSQTEVVVAQGNIDQSLKWNKDFQDATLDIYRTLSLKEKGPETALIVWPETATPFFFQNIDDKHRRVIDIARGAGTYLLFGSPSYGTEGGQNRYRNSAYLVSPQGAVVGKYDKVHLVPYGEYVPLKDLFFFIEKLVVGVGDFVPGKKVMPLKMDDELIGTLICYEGIFPEIGRQYALRGVTLLVSITNDAWFGASSAPYQHLTMTAFRAIENRVYIVRAANTGISAVIKPTGEIVSATGLFERTAFREKIRFVRQTTFYSKYGDIFIYLCIIAIIWLVVISLKRRKIHDRRHYRSN